MQFGQVQAAYLSECSSRTTGSHPGRIAMAALPATRPPRRMGPIWSLILALSLAGCASVRPVGGDYIRDATPEADRAREAAACEVQAEHRATVGALLWPFSKESYGSAFDACMRPRATPARAADPR